MRRFADHKYVRTSTPWGVEHQWSFRGPKGGLHFTASQPRKADISCSCGLEIHYSFDPSSGREAPHHAPCWLLGGPCWHDGTSLYARETLWPIIEPMLKSGDHDTILRVLENEYDRHFEKFEKEAAG